MFQRPFFAQVSQESTKQAHLLSLLNDRLFVVWILGGYSSKLYFPSENETLSIILTYSVFVVNFVLRSLRCLILGSLGDKAV